MYNVINDTIKLYTVKGMTMNGDVPFCGLKPWPGVIEAQAACSAP